MPQKQEPNANLKEREVNVASEKKNGRMAVAFVRAKFIRSDTLEKLGLPSTSERIREIMRSRGMDEKGLTEKSRLSAKQIEDVLFRPDDVPLWVFDRLCEVLEVTLERLVGEV